MHFFAILLWVAGGLAIVAGLPQLGLAIVAVVIINSGDAGGAPGSHASGLD